MKEGRGSSGVYRLVTAVGADSASGRHGGSPRHTHLTAVAQLATGQRHMLKPLELLSLSIASALDEQNDVHTAW
jgi:hypothetical protein